MGSKRIYIVTLGARFMFSNVGTFLQHWALRKTLTEMGFFPARVAGKKDYNHIAVNNVQWCNSLVKQFVKVLLHYLKFNKYAKEASCNINSFRDYIQAKRFRNGFIKNIGDCIEETSSQAETMILGGDQVFSVNDLKRTMEVSTSNFISYAASTDWLKKSNDIEWKETVMQVLPSFSSIGVRENKGVDTLKQMGVVATRVADPVMLINSEDLIDFASSKPIFTDPTLFVYLLNIPNKVDLHIESMVSAAKDLKTRLHMHGIQGAQLYIPSKYYLHLGPTDFVKAVMDADYFITNSYHGTVLALMLHKPFVSVMQDKTDVKTQNVRQQELLEMVGLQNHHITMSEFDYKGLFLLKERVDWSDVDAKIENLRSFSLEWLKTALKD